MTKPNIKILPRAKVIALRDRLRREKAETRTQWFDISCDGQPKAGLWEISYGHEAETKPYRKYYFDGQTWLNPLSGEATLFGNIFKIGWRYRGLAYKPEGNDK